MSETAKSSRRLFPASSAQAASIFGALGVANAALSVDPVFAAIERHKATILAFTATEEDTEAAEAAADEESEALADFLETVPLTIAGIKAALEYAVGGDFSYELERLVPALLQSPLLAGAGKS